MSPFAYVLRDDGDGDGSSVIEGTSQPLMVMDNCLMAIRLKELAKSSQIHGAAEDDPVRSCRGCFATRVVGCEGGGRLCPSPWITPQYRSLHV